MNYLIGGGCTSAWAGALLLLFILPSNLIAAESGSRAYANKPVEMNILQFLYRKSERNDQLHIRSDIGVLRYMRTMDVFGKIALVGGYLPFGEVRLSIPAVGYTTKASGIGDPTLVVGMDFIGASALNQDEFKAYKQDLIVGGSFQLTMPFGNYHSNSSVNLSANQWVLKPEIAVSKAIGDFQFEVYGNVHIYSDNEEYLGGNIKGRQILWGVDTHLSYDIMPGSRISIDYFREWGGESSINGQWQKDTVADTTVGVTAHLAWATEHSIQLRYRKDLKTHSGNKYQTFLVQYQFLWF